LTRLAESILQDRQEAEDAVQQAFISAATRLERYLPGTDFTAWIYTITVNVCRGALRRKRARNGLLRLIGRSHLAQACLHPEDALLQSEASRRLWEAVDRLDNKQRLVVLLRYQEDLPVHTIAQILSIPEATVYTRLYTALRRLRPELDAPPEKDPSEVEIVRMRPARLKGNDR
jgi:RNA polymerase sigma-70 factor (ECF subfamily)